MKYFVLLADGEQPDWEQLTPEEQGAAMSQHNDFATACEERDGVAIVGGEALADPSASTTVRTRSGERTITDGPFAEAAEQIGGFYVLEAPDLDTVIELVGILPPYDVDIRPVLEFG